MDYLAVRAAGDALVAILSRLHTYRGDSRFTTWTRKFVLVEAGAKVRRDRRAARAIRGAGRKRAGLRACLTSAGRKAT
jgi:RNA polymerase sigma-70 factor, ECF subfamily